MAEEGIVGRGVLLDVHRWRLSQTPPIPYDAFSGAAIPLSHLIATAEAQGTTIQFGDILLVRSGFFVEQDARTEEQLHVLKGVHPPCLSGVEQSKDVLKWIWERFSAVAGDMPGFECWRSLYPSFSSFS